MSTGMSLSAAFPAIDFANYNAIRTSDIEQQNMFGGEVIEVNDMPLWKKVSLFLTFVCGLMYGVMHIVNAIIHNPSGIDGIIIYLTIILSFMGLSFGGYKFAMRNNVKESLQIIERNASKRDANAQIRHNQIMSVSKTQTDILAKMNSSLAPLAKMESSLAKMESSLASIDKSLRRK